MTRLATAGLVMVAAGAIGGCGTCEIMLRPFKSVRPFDCVYGGVRGDAKGAAEKAVLVLRHDSPEEVREALREGCLRIADLPLSFIGDTLILPLVPIFAYHACRARAEQDRSPRDTRSRVHPGMTRQEVEAAIAPARSTPSGFNANLFIYDYTCPDGNLCVAYDATTLRVQSSLFTSKQ